MKYRSGEDIKRGDRVRFHGNPAQIAAVASAAFCDPDDTATAWYVHEYGGGVLILDPVISGGTFIPEDQISDCEDLEFVSRPEAQ